MKTKLAMYDLDGTLFNTSEVNYYSYKEALEQQGYSLQHDYFCEECNGRHYTTFIPAIIGDNKECMEKIHNRKKELYRTFLSKAILNQSLLTIAKAIAGDYHLAIVTTASRQNTVEILRHFDILELFELVLTQEDFTNPKPDPEGYLQGMKYFGVDANNTIIFEDSDVGVAAARASGAVVYKVEKF